MEIRLQRVFLTADRVCPVMKNGLFEKQCTLKRVKAGHLPEKEIF